MLKLIFLLCLIRPASAQQYIISTAAGIGLLPFGGANGPALNAILISPQYVAVDPAGNVFVTDAYYQQVFKISTSGTITVYAGTGQPGFSGDGGPAAAAQLTNPLGIATDAAGNLFIMDNGNGRIRKVTPDGKIATVASVGGASLAVDMAGNMYVSQSLANIVHKVTAGGAVTTYAGTGTQGALGDGGKATAAQLNGPGGLRADAAGNLFVADTGNNKIRKIDAQGTITTVAGNGQTGFAGDSAPAINARLAGPADVAVGGDGSLYIADNANGRIRMVDARGVIFTFAGGASGGAGGTLLGDGPAAQVLLQGPIALALDNAGGVVVAVEGNHQVRRVTPPGITTVAGVLPTVGAGDNIPATSAALFSPYGIAVDPSGAVYLSDVTDNRIRKISSAGTISTLAGDGLAGQSADGAAAVLAGSPQGLALDKAGSLYFTTNQGSLVRRLAPDGTVTTLAGSTGGFGGDNAPAVKAQLSLPLGVAQDAAGNVYIADSNNNRIRRVDIATGQIHTIAGTGAATYGGDGGPATAAALSHPSQLALDSSGNLFIADTGNSRVRKISLDGTITTVAGNGVAGESGDGGDATLAQLLQPGGLAVDGAGNLYISTRFGARIRRVDAASGTISTIAGTGGTGFSGDGGFATSALINAPENLAVDSAGNVYFADSRNHRVRMLTPAQITPAGVLNGASLRAGPVAPGEIVAINGSAIGPAQTANAQVTDAGTLATSAGGTQVLFDGTPAALISAQAGQVRAIVPYAVAGQASTQVQIAVNGKNTNTISLPVAATAPGIFTQDASGAGAGAITNADSTTNSPANPAAAGTVVTIAATGEGQTMPPGVDGLQAADPAPAPVAAVSVQIGGMDAPVIYAGGAPGLTAGFFQVAVQIPAGAPTGDAIPIVLTVGGVASQPGVTVSIQ